MLEALAFNFHRSKDQAVTYEMGGVTDALASLEAAKRKVLL